MDPIFMDFLEGTFETISARELECSLTFRRNCYRPYFFNDEKYKISVQTKTQRNVVLGTGMELKNRKKQKEALGNWKSFRPQLQKEILEEGGMIINFKIVEKSPSRAVLEEFFQTKAYVQKLL